MSINFSAVDFITSAAKANQFVPDQGAEVAFVGRSNAGKSSALNALANNRKLARVSKTPGRTQLINFFALANHHRLVDLPGYGYAKAPLQQRRNWQLLINAYLLQRQSLCGLVLLTDIRHFLKPNDWQLVEWVVAGNYPLHILLTKADKLKRGAAMTALHQAKQILAQQQIKASLQLFSATSKMGLDELKMTLGNWLQVESETGGSEKI